MNLLSTHCKNKITSDFERKIMYNWLNLRENYLRFSYNYFIAFSFSVIDRNNLLLLVLVNKSILEIFKSKRFPFLVLYFIKIHLYIYIYIVWIEIWNSFHIHLFSKIFISSLEFKIPTSFSALSSSSHDWYNNTFDFDRLFFH